MGQILFFNEQGAGMSAPVVLNWLAVVKKMIGTI
jgi:hypothetical protein